MKHIVLLLILLSLSPAWSVSRVGGGKIRSQGSGFEMTLPIRYSYSDIGSNSVRGRDNASASWLSPVSFFEIKELQDTFPEYNLKNREDLFQVFNKWTIIREDSCIVILTLRSETSFSYLGFLGSNKGFVVVGTNTSKLSNDVTKMLESLNIDEHICQ